MEKVNNWNLGEKYSKIIPSTSYLTHGIHKYTAKLIPQIPRYFIEKYSQENDIIYDPFCGSGTALLEAILSSRNAIGIDINPLAVLISEVKTMPLNINELDSAILLVKKSLMNDKGKTDVEFPNINYWFCEKAQNELSEIRYCVENARDQVDKNIYNFLLVCFSSIIRKSSYADPRMAKTYKSKRVRVRIKNGWVPEPIQYFEEALDRNFDRIKLLSEHLNTNNHYVKAFQGDAKRTSFMLKQNGVEEADFIITSPPYINAQDYFRSYKLELWWLGLASADEVKHFKKHAIGTESIPRTDYKIIPRSEIDFLNAILERIWKKDKKKSHIVHYYFENMKSFFRGSYKALRRGGYFCLVTGNNTICGVQIPTYKVLIHMAENNGFKLVEIGKDKIKNRLLPPNRNHDGGVIKEEWITVFEKKRS